MNYGKIRAEVSENKRDLIIFVYNKSDGKTVSDASVFVNRKHIPFDKDLNAYVIRRANQKGLVSVSHHDNVIFYELDRGSDNSTVLRLLRKISYTPPIGWICYPFRFIYRGIRYYGPYGLGFHFGSYGRYSKYRGFIAFSKPKYLPGDTVKWKAYILNTHNRPIKKDVQVNMFPEYREYQSKQIAVLKPVSRGTYVGQFALKDSLKINMRYTLCMTHGKRNKKLLKSSFLLEDYQLDETSYTLKSLKETWHRGDSIILNVSGNDVNGMNLVDSRVELEVTSGNVKDIYNTTVFIPNVLWRTQKMLEPAGETRFSIPPEVLPLADMNMNVKAIFKNSNNEIHEEKLNLNYIGRKDFIKVGLNGNEVRATFFKNGIPEKSEGSLCCMNGKDTVFKQDITYPFSCPLNQLYGKYVFRSNLTSEFLEISSYLPGLQISSFRNKDTLQLYVNNPKNLEFHYIIYKEKNQYVTEGNGTKLNWVLLNPGSDSYYLSVQYFWGGIIHEKTCEVHLWEKDLNVKMDQPALVFPGQKAKLTVHVTDYLNQPVPEVNLTAGAVNAQFKEKGIPDVPYLGKFKHRFPYVNTFRMDLLEINNTRLMTKEWVKKMKLDTIPYYSFIFPENGMALYYDSIGIRKAQFSAYLFKDGRRLPIYLLYLDNNPVYYYDANTPEPYSFKAKPGYHTIRIRAYDKEYSIDSVLLKAGNKLEISLDPDHLPSSVHEVKKHAYLNDAETRTVYRKFVEIDNNFRDKVAYMWQKDRIIQFPKYGHTSYYLDFFDYDTVHFAVQNGFATKFVYEPGYKYLINDGMIKLKSLGDNRGKHSLFRYFSMPKSWELALEKEDIQLKKIVEQVNPRFNMNPQYTIQGNGTYVFEYLGDSSFSQFVVYTDTAAFYPRFYKGYNRRVFNLPPGYYNILFQTDSRNCFLRDSIKIQADGRLFEQFDHRKLKSTQSLIEDSTFSSQEKLRTIRPVAKSGFFFLTDNSTTTGQGSGMIKGRVIDLETQEPIPFATVIIEQNGEMIGGATSDFYGNYSIRPISPGKYDVKANFVGYKTQMTRNVVINGDKITFLDIEMEGSALLLESIEIKDYKIPLISKDRTSTGGTVTSEGISRMPNRSADAVATTVGGVFSSDDEYGSVRGQRSEGTVMYIDGIRVRGSSSPSLFGSADFSLYKDLSSFSSNAIRSNFSDCAYWEPNLFTDKNGMATFEVKFPDNVTSWQSYSLAISEHKQSGTGFAETHSMKPLMANLAIPRFLIRGDQSNIIGKSLNYSGFPQKIKTEFRLDNKSIKTRDTVINDVCIDNTIIQANGKDSLKLSYSLSNSEGFFDGEERSIPVFPVGIEESTGQFLVIDQDTSLTIKIPSGSKELYVYAQNNMLETMLQQLDYLKEYPYSCMEQTASKLKAYLMEKKIDTRLKKHFRHEATVSKLIQKLVKGQNIDGSWGWWEESPANIWMTSYVTRSVLMAESMDYHTNCLEMAASFLKDHLEVSKGSEILDALNTLSQLGVELPYEGYLKKVGQDSLSTYQKLLVVRIKQRVNIPYNIEDILNRKKSSLLGGIFWGENTDLWFDNTTNSTLLAYQILETKDSIHPLLQGITHYLLDLKKTNKWRNTIETANVLETILPWQLKQSNNTLLPLAMTFSGAIDTTATKFPVVIRQHSPSDRIFIRKTGTGPVFLTVYEKSWNSSPNVVDSVFRINTWFETDGTRPDSLRAGVSTEIVVQVDVKKQAEYCMLEIPIPAGCSYGDNSKSVQFGEVHREYFKNKTSIFCEHLSIGKHLFRIKLQPRYTGVYTLNPAKIELMYFPTFYGRNALRKSRIY